ncbi:Leucine rich repeat-containing protein [Butyrivibrio sp. ob235]|uniref:leucine-rich repeat domain-containing protein n=1 Tax=Butyrivibrio sp. ob235 TaxID=1761780 RepID=UPI0008B2DA6A|nr:leucine-rich repeat domain-containing protein [Butyrivibrio sp. ob235]SEM00154.1 Leucine rich repeat-containing protein [Butyrivibrio sp. ob235]
MFRKKLSRILSMMLPAIMLFTTNYPYVHAAEEITEITDTVDDTGVEEISGEEDSAETIELRVRDANSGSEADTTMLDESKTANTAEDNDAENLFDELAEDNDDSDNESLEDNSEEPAEEALEADSVEEDASGTEKEQVIEPDDTVTEDGTEEDISKDVPQEDEAEVSIDDAETEEAEKKEQSEESVDESVERELTEETENHRITVVGTFPENAQLAVKEITYLEEIEENVSNLNDMDASFTIYDAYDIEILVDGITWQPVEHESTVDIEITGIEIPDEAEEIKVQRVEDDNESVTDLSYEITEDTLTFTTEHFTVFTIGGTSYDSDAATMTYDLSAAGDGSIMAYYYEDDAKLVISGSGDMKDFNDSYSGPKSPIATNLKNETYDVVLSDDITKIGAYLFKDCEKATITSLPQNLREIGKYAFYNCDALSITELPENLEVIGDYAFFVCSGTAISKLPDNITQIGKAAFSYSTMEITQLPAGMTVIESKTFENCENIKEIEIHDGIESIGKEAFSSCSALEKITFGGSVKSIGERAFDYISNRIEINGGDGITEIGNRAFYTTSWGEKPVILNSQSEALLNYDWASDNRKLAEVAVNDSGYDLTGITPIDISKSQDKSVLAYYLEDSAEGDKLIVIGKGDTNSYLYSEKSPITENYGNKSFELIMSDGITSFGERLFKDCAKMTCKKLPESLTTVGDYAFSGCASIDPEFGSDLTVIKYHAFEYCTGLTTKSLPDSITTIKYNAFYDCYNMQLEHLPDSLKEIEMYTFFNCKNLRLKDLPSNLTEVGFGAFTDCENIEITEIPEGVTAIYTQAFSGCKKITSIHFPDSLKIVRSTAFQNCNDLTTITGGDNITDLDDNAFFATIAYSAIPIKTYVESSNEVFKTYDWRNSQRMLPIVGSFKVVVPAMVSLDYKDSYLEGTIPIRVDTTNFVEGDVVFVTTGYDMELNGAGDTISVIVNKDKERWYSGDDSTGEINLIAYPDSFDNLDTYEGELVLNILSGHQ